MIPRMITIHCSDTPPTMDIGAAEIRKWHTDAPPVGRGWKDIGYHLVIRRSGEVERGRALNEQGAHVEGFNQDNVGICLVGGRPGNGLPGLFTITQFDALQYQIDSLLMIYKTIRPWDIHGHYEFSSAKGKTCPNMDMKRVMQFLQNGNLEPIKEYIYKP
jgi:N-acetylmuramoyl-L-alanine amidase